MARLFDGVDDKIVCALGSANSALAGAFTLSFLLRPDSSHFGGWINTTGGNDWAVWQDGTDIWIFTASGPERGFYGHLTAGDWHILHLSKPSGTSTPRLHSRNLRTGTWRHTNGDGTAANDSASAGRQWIIGREDFTGATFDGAISAMAMYGSAIANDAAAEARTTWATWMAASPAIAWDFRTLPLEDLGSGGTADQVSITGTTATDPPAGFFPAAGTDYDEDVDDSVSVSDSVTIQWSARRSVSDGVAATDQAARQWSAERTVDDSATAADSTATTWAANRSVDDQVEASDDASPSAGYVRSVDDTLTGTDDLASAWASSRAVDDSLEAGDQVGRTVDLRRKVDDAATATDEAARQASFTRDLSDDLEATDDVQTAEAGKIREQVDDTVEATDEAKTAWTAHLAIDDSLEAADQVSAREAGHDTLSLGDTIGATDDLSAAISIRIDDGASLADDVQTDLAAQIRLTIDDGITVTDSFARTWVASRFALEVMQALDELVVGFGSQPAIVDLRELATTSVALRAAATTGIRLRERATTSIQLTEEPR